ncbi:MAG: hypothetical protein ACK4TL_07315 [Hyphomicrobiaceae bacterium]
MSTRQRGTLDATAASPSGGAQPLARALEGSAEPDEDIAARRLHELAQRLSGAHVSAPDAGADSPLDSPDAEFERVSLAAIVALGRQQAPDTPDDTLVEARAAAEDSGPALAIARPVSLPVPTTDAAAARVEGPEAATKPAPEAAPAQPLAALPREAAESDTAPATIASSQPLMLTDQSAADIRLVDLIRRQQSLLDQLNRFPPTYPAPGDAAVSDPGPAAVAPQPVFELLAPPPGNADATTPFEIPREAPPPLPPKEELPPAPDEFGAEAPPEAALSELSELSPIIIQRARAERSGRRLGPVAAPPSTMPAFLVGLGAAFFIAGILLVIL